MPLMFGLALIVDANGSACRMYSIGAMGIKSCLEVWKTGDLTYQGKVLIHKTCIISQINFEIEMRGIPER
jgi:hypothetical protein